MRVPSHLLLVFFAILAAVEAYVIPEGGKYPSSVANPSYSPQHHYRRETPEEPHRKYK